MRKLISVLTLLSIAACGGSSGGGPIMSPPPVVVDANPVGFWTGTLENEDATFEELVGISTLDGRIRFISIDTFGPDTFAQYIGDLTIDGSDVVGIGQAFAQPGSTWSNGASVVEFSLTGIIDEQNIFSGSWENSIGETVTFDLDYDPAVERTSSIALLQGVWYVYDDMLNPTLTLTIQADGSFSGQNDVGCHSIGQVSIIDSDWNIYAWSVVISGCAIMGNYSGLAVLGDIDTGDPANSQDNFLLVSMNNLQRALLLPLER